MNQTKENPAAVTNGAAKLNTHSSANNTAMMDAAQEYARRGWYVFPVYETDGESCACNKADCTHQGKHPRSHNGLKDATTDPQAIAAWWARWPSANIGIATGASGLLVLDVDDGGEDSLANHSSLPDTVETITGSGGRHFLFKRPEGYKFKSCSKIEPGLDVRADGGYIVAPPSIHRSGRRYEWDAMSEPDEIPLACPPEWLVKAVRGKPQAKAHTETTDLDDAVRVNRQGLPSYTDAMLEAIPADDRETWISVGMALHDADPGGGLDTWDTWSQKSDKYKDGEPAEKWLSFGPHPDPITMRSVYHAAVNHGWKPTVLAKKELGPSKAAERIAADIKAQTLLALSVDEKEQPEAAQDLAADAGVVDRMISGAFWSGSKGKLFLLNHSDSLLQFPEKDAFKFLAKTFGRVVDRSAITAAVDEMGLEPKPRADLIKACMATPRAAILEHLKYHSQRENIEWRADMFADHSRMVVEEGHVRIVLTHKPYPDKGSPDPRIVADFKEHFPRFDEFLTFLVMARFCLDRKHAYLWLWAESDWGKGFLVGVLQAMDATVDTSMKEIESMFEGKPVGRSPEEFKRSIVLVIDEFKTVKSELKQLQSHITLAPKNQLSSRVEIFSKLFLSAESVGSLVTENGVEDQFANRMSLFKEKGSLIKRPVYKEVGNPRYFEAILAYTVRALNSQIADMRAEGRMAAQTGAEQWLNGFIARNGLDTLYDRFSASMPQVADAILEHVRSSQFSFLIHQKRGLFLTSPAKVIDDYINDHYDPSQIAAIRKKKPELMEMMSEDGRGSATHRITQDGKGASIPNRDDGKVIKAIWLKLSRGEQANAYRNKDEV